MLNNTPLSCPLFDVMIIYLMCSDAFDLNCGVGILRVKEGLGMGLDLGDATIFKDPRRADSEDGQSCLWHYRMVSQSPLQDGQSQPICQPLVVISILCCDRHLDSVRVVWCVYLYKYLWQMFYACDFTR